MKKGYATMKPENTNATRVLADFMADLSYDAIPEKARVSARRCLLEILSGAVAGYPTDYLSNLDKEMSPPVKNEATVIGSERSHTVEQAAFINASAAVIKEFIGGHRFSYSMPVIASLPTALACAEYAGSTGRELVTAIVAGAEAHARIGMACLPMKMTFHPHGTVATMGTACAAGKVAGFDREHMYSLFNVASVLPIFAHRRTTFEGGTVRNAYPGFSARNGILAMKMVRAGFCGVEDGIATCFAETVAEKEFHPEIMLDELGVCYECSRNYYKLHSCDRHLHGSIELVDELIKKHGADVINPDSIDHIEVYAYLRAARCNSKTPRNAIASQWSIPHGIAAQIILGRSDAEAFSEEAVHNPAIQALAQRVDVTEDPAYTAMCPDKRPSRVVIILKDGRRFQADAPLPSAEFDSDEPDSVIEGKLKTKCRKLFVLGGMTEALADKIIDVVDHVDDLPNISPLMSLLAAPYKTA